MPLERLTRGLPHPRSPFCPLSSTEFVEPLPKKIPRYATGCEEEGFSVEVVCWSSFLNCLCRKLKETAIFSFMQCETLTVDVCCFMWWGSTTVICVVVLQNGVDVVESETGSYSGTGVACNVDGMEEVSIKLEEAIDIKDEIPEAVPFPPIKTELEVRLWGVWEVVATHAYCPKKEIVKLHLTNSGCVCFMFWVPYTFWNLNCNLKIMYLVEVIAINVRIILECNLNGSKCGPVMDCFMTLIKCSVLYNCG